MQGPIFVKVRNGGACGITEAHNEILVNEKELQGLLSLEQHGGSS